MPRNQEFADDVSGEANASPRAKKHPTAGSEPGTTSEAGAGGGYHIEREATIDNPRSKNRGMVGYEESSLAPAVQDYEEDSPQGQTDQGSTLDKAGVS